MKEKFTEHFAPFSYITSPLFDRHGIRHLFTRRDGGVSRGVYKSLNLAAGSGCAPDDWANVVENHRIVAASFGMTEKDICRSYQTHSTTVLTVDESFKGTGIDKPPFPTGVDGLVCGDEGVLLSVRGADCVTVLFYDPVGHLCGACHSGWRGTAGKIALNTVEAMVAAGAKAKDILVAIGPSVGGCCYKVGDEVKNAFLSVDSAFEACFTQDLKLDLQKAVELTLLKAGVRAEHISDCGECTVCDGGKNYFSHRLCGADRGTMAAFITV